MRVLRETATALPGRFAGREPLVLLTEFGDSPVQFEIFVWSEDPWRARVTKSALNEAIWWAFKRERIVIAYPQMDVHMAAAPSPATSAESSRGA